MADDLFDKMIEMSMGMAIAREIPQMMDQAPLVQKTTPSTPPPLASVGIQLYAAINNTQAGPFTEQELITLIQRGLVNSNTLVWKQGLPSWAPASSVPEVGKLLLLYSNI